MGPRQTGFVLAVSIPLLAVVHSGCGTGDDTPAGGGAATPGSGRDDPPPRADAGRIESHMAFLADDALRGREPGTEGYRTAAAHVADDFRMAGLRPAGDAGDYLQSVPLRTVFRRPERARMSIHTPAGAAELAHGSDFVIDAEPAHDASSATAPVVFVGFGIVAPELGFDDYEGLDVDGKIVLVLEGAPAGLPTDARAHLTRGETKARSAADHGAIGMLRTAVDGGDAALERAARGLERGALTWSEEDGTGHDAAPAVRVGALVSRRTTERLLEGAAGSLADIVTTVESGGAPAGFSLVVDVTLEQASRGEDSRSPNVVGILPGGDPGASDEHVVLTAHLDHVGVGPAENGDDIYNGAGDNASGSAILMEVARILAARPQPPRRSIVFVAVTAEERGLVGSDYFVHRPPIPAEQIVANINLDSGVFLYDFADIIPFGTAYSSLETNVRRVADRFGLGVGPDPLPEEALFTRSDHYRFVQQGIPSMFFMCGMQARDPTVDGIAELRRYVAEHLHRPSDDMTLPWHFGAAARYADFIAAVTLDVADDDARPAWRPGNVFARLAQR